MHNPTIAHLRDRADEADKKGHHVDAEALRDAANILAVQDMIHPDIPRIGTVAEYQRAASVTAVYSPDTPAYPFLGLAGECGELTEVIVDPIINYDRLVKELGDVCWYYAAICRDVWPDNGLAMSTLCLPHPGPYPAWSPADIPVAVGMCCEAAKKCLRDDAGKWTDARRSKLKDGLMALGYALHGCCHTYKLDFLDVLQVNINKLYARKARGTLHGSGDNR